MKWCGKPQAGRGLADDCCNAKIKVGIECFIRRKYDTTAMTLDEFVARFGQHLVC